MDFIHEPLRKLIAAFQKFDVGFGGDDEPRRYRQANLSHSAQSGALASQ